MPSKCCTCQLSNSTATYTLQYLSNFSIKGIFTIRTNCFSPFRGSGKKTGQQYKVHIPQIKHFMTCAQLRPDTLLRTLPSRHSTGRNKWRDVKVVLYHTSLLLRTGFYLPRRWHFGLASKVHPYCTQPFGRRVN